MKVITTGTGTWSDTCRTVFVKWWNKVRTWLKCLIVCRCLMPASFWLLSLWTSSLWTAWRQMISRTLFSSWHLCYHGEWFEWWTVSDFDNVTDPGTYLVRYILFSQTLVINFKDKQWRNLTYIKRSLIELRYQNITKTRHRRKYRTIERSEISLNQQMLCHMRRGRE